jgi:phage/plasmid-associated DNA primase
MNDIISHFYISMIANIGNLDEFFIDNLIVFNNGTYNTKTKLFGAHSPLSPCLFSLPFSWNPGLLPVKTLQFLWEFSDNDGLVFFGIRCFLHQLLTSNLNDQLFGHFQGPANTGKSIMLLILSALVGVKAIVSTSLNALSSNPFELVNLRNKRLILISDADNCQNSDYSTIKSITGGDILMGRQKYIQLPLDFYPVGWLVIATNNLLFESEDDGAIERRNLRFPATRVSSKREKLLQFNKKTKEYIGPLSDELSSLINWSLELNDDLSSRFLKNTYQVYDQNKDDISLKLTVKNYVKLFIDSCDINEGTFLSKKGGLFESFLEYQSSDFSESKKITLKDFSRLLGYALTNSKIRYIKMTKNEGTFFKGITINPKKSFKVTLKKIEPLSLCDFKLLSNNCNIVFDIDQINSSLKTGIVENHIKKNIEFEQFTNNFVKQLSNS